jgi:hypothetical protein
LRLALTRLWGGTGLQSRSWAVAPGARPVERAFWRARDVDFFGVSLEEYVEALAMRVGITVEAVP